MKPNGTPVASRIQTEELVLYVSADNPHDADRIAEQVMKAFDPTVKVERVKAYAEVSTPRLLVGRNFYRGLASIQAFIDQARFGTRQRA